MDSKTLKKIKELEQERERLLMAHPHLHVLQFEIEERLLEAGEDPVKRMLVVNDMLMNFVDQKFLPSLKALKKCIKRLKSVARSDAHLRLVDQEEN